MDFAQFVEIATIMPTMPILMDTQHGYWGIELEAKKFGVRLLVPKTDDCGEPFSAIETMLSSGTNASRAILPRVTARKVDKRNKNKKYAAYTEQDVAAIIQVADSIEQSLVRFLVGTGFPHGRSCRRRVDINWAMFHALQLSRFPTGSPLRRCTGPARRY